MKIKNKRAMSGWIWALIIIAIIVIGVLIYFSLTGGSDGGSTILSGGSSIPQPPALPS